MAKPADAQSPCVIAAGFYQSVAIGTSARKFTGDDVEDEEGDEGGDVLFDNEAGEKANREGHVLARRVHAFGDNRNHIIGHACPYEKAAAEKTAKACPKCQKLIKDGHYRPSRPAREAPHFFDDKDISQVRCGSNHTVYLEKREHQAGGTVWASGLAANGRLGCRRPEAEEECLALLEKEGYEGDPDIDNKELAGHVKSCSYPNPVKVQITANNLRVSFIACGADHTLVVTVRGLLFTWGLGSFGNLGHGNADDYWEPKQVTLPTQQPVSMAAAGTKHSMALTTDGAMFSWGHGGNGRLGLGVSLEACLSPRAVQVIPQAKMKWIAAGEAHSGSIDVLGNCFCWGAGSYGRTGHGEESDAPLPKLMYSLSGQSCNTMELGTLHSLSLTTIGTVYGWGSGAAVGTLDSATEIQGVPKQVVTSDLQKRPIVQIAAGNFHSLALQDGGILFAWGVGSHGRLGLFESEFEDRWKPNSIPRINVWCPAEEDQEGAIDNGKAALALTNGGGHDKPHGGLQVGGGGSHSCVFDEKTAWLFGGGEHGQTGQASNEDFWDPDKLLLPGARMIIKCISLGLEHTLAVTTQGELLAWGRNHMGQLGLGTQKSMNTPTPVVGMTDVVQVAAGEDHSMCRLQSGALCTWGSAEGGKLGHGASMTSGCVQVPRLVDFSEQALIVRCAAQHSCIVNQSGQVFSFGVGWFGRLGHDDMSNQYVPKRAETFTINQEGDLPPLPITPPFVTEVQCAAYHTYAVTRDGRLFSCGRAEMCHSSDHVKTFTREDEIEDLTEEDGSHVKVQQISASNLHTLLLSQQGTLFAWGDNRCGQLGLGSGIGHHVWEPTRVTIPAWKRNFIPVQIAAGHHHSIVAMNMNDTVYSWGLRSGGRLGHPREDVQERLCYQPQKLQFHFSEDDGIQKTEKEEEPAAIKDKDDQDNPDEKEKAQEDTLPNVQRKLQGEKKEYTVEELLKEEGRLKEIYQDYIEDIFALWKKPSDPNKICEDRIRELRAQLEKSLCRNQRRMRLGEEYPKIENKIHPEVTQRLIYCEPMVWMLQQQPCYLCALSQVIDKDVIKGRSLSHNYTIDDIRFPKRLISDMVKYLYNDLEDERTRHLLMAFCRRMMTIELEKREKVLRHLETIFHPNESHVHQIFCDAIKKNYFLEMHKKLFDASDPDSLVAIVEDWTTRATFAEEKVEKAPEKGKKEKAPAATGGDEEVIDDALFVFHEKELMEFESGGAEDGDGGDKSSERERMDLLRRRLQEQMRIFKMFLETGFVQFMDKLTHPKNMQSITKIMKWGYESILARGTDELKKKRTSSHTDHEELERTLAFEPLVRLYQSSIIGQLLVTADKVMSSDHIHALRTRLMGKVNADGLDNEAGKTTLSTQKTEKKVQDAIRRVQFNLKQLGRFLQKGAQNDFTAGEIQLQLFANEVRTRVMHKFVVDKVSLMTDDTETSLTIDLYTSHYDTKDHYVIVPTVDLLHTSNALWLYQAEVFALDRPDEDQLLQLLQKFMPPVAQQAKPLLAGLQRSHDADKERIERMARCWPFLVLMQVEQANQKHNFLINHRFLETQQDLCFCRKCQSPIPRSMAPNAQRIKAELRLLKTYKPPLGPTFEGQNPFVVLMDLLMSKDINKIVSKEFVLVKFEFEENQKNTMDMLNEKPPEQRSVAQYTLVAQLEKGKKCIDLLKAHHLAERDFIEFVNKVLLEHQQHNKYLQMVRKGSDKIKESQKKYRTRLEEMDKGLRKTVEMSDNLVMPVVFRIKAGEAGVSLKYQDAERVKRKENRKDNMPDIGHMAPSGTYTLYYLRYKGVIARMGAEEEKQRLPTDQYKFIKFTFEMSETADWTIIVTRSDQGKQHMLCSFDIAASEIEKMKRAGKGAKLEYNDGFVVINCFELLQLLARLLAS
eukprot:TRINITY_DN17377_c0_g1_i1.p1 TRINITY_DN17377_c0_g1~~TRINITY_DN17377_c0_g1_i1.p1  ORF type:complete len:1888 (-),score=508.37 TRINITY_DN17377_c0_g1_i1:111-5774(-)